LVQAWGIYFFFELLYALSLAQLRGKKELAFFTIPTWITNDLFHLNDARELQQVYSIGNQWFSAGWWAKFRFAKFLDTFAKFRRNFMS
jgi:hypothetical protein